jgi:hypothetical protein
MSLPFDLLNHPIIFSPPRRLTPMSAWVEHIPFGMFLVELLQPRIIVELGTASGESYCAFCQAVEELNLDTRCYAVDTWEGDPHAGFYGPEILADLREHHDPLYGNISRLIQSTFTEALDDFADGTIDLLHIDGFHTYEVVKHDFETWLPKVSSAGVVLLHDTNVQEKGFGVWKFWGEIKSRYQHMEFVHGHGLGVLAIGERRSKGFQELLDGWRERGFAVALEKFFFQEGRKLTLLVQSFEEKKRIKEAQTQGQSALEAVRAQLAEAMAQKEHALQDLQRQVAGHEAQLQTVKDELEEAMAGKEAALLEAHEQAARLERQDLELKEQCARADELAVKVDALGREVERLRGELAKKDTMIGRLEGVIQGLLGSIRQQAEEQAEKLRAELGERDARLLAAIENIQARARKGQPAAEGEPAAKVQPSAEVRPASLVSGRVQGPPRVKKTMDRQEYRKMIERLREVVASTVPANAIVAVVSKGDPELLQLEGRQGWHFPQQYDGTYAGFHPKDSRAALEGLYRVQAKGATFLLLPATALWWLDYYKEFAAHLGREGRVLARDDETGVIFALPAKPVPELGIGSTESPQCSPFLSQLRGVINGILPPDSKVVVLNNGDRALLELGKCAALEFPHPANGSGTLDSARAIAQLEELKKTGVHFFVVPKTASPWLDDFQEFGRYLEKTYRPIVRQRHVCTIFDLNER